MNDKRATFGYNDCEVCHGAGGAVVQGDGDEWWVECEACIERCIRERDALRSEAMRLDIALNGAQELLDFALKFLPGQKARVYIDDPDTSEYAALNGQLVTLRTYVEPNSDEPVWCCETESGEHADLFWYELKPLEVTK